MKSLTLVSMILGSMLTASARAQAGIVADHLSNIQDRVRSCTVLPYKVKNGHRVFQNLLSHCPEVQIIAKFKAKIKVGGKHFQAQLVETVDTDGDLYDLAIREPSSGDVYRLRNVLAYGDVLLGVLAGNTAGIAQARIQDR